eukprot:s4363_g5.t3
MKFWELDHEEASNLELFEQVLWIRTGFDLSRAWAILDPNNRQALTIPEFVRGCRELGFDGDAVHIFKGRTCRLSSILASDAVLQKIRLLLRHLDKDRTGTVSQRQFEWLLRSNLPAVEAVSREDLDHMWSTFAKRADGDIEYEDLIQWILKPSTPLTVSSTWELTFFDLKSHLEPLFWAYDQDRDGIINWEEFMETHGVLQNALRLNPSLEGEKDPAMIKGDLHHCYLTMIGFEGDRRLTFARFITWQRDALMSSSLPSDVLAKTLRSVAKQLQRVFKLSEIEKRGQLSESDKQVLVRILQHLAQFSRELWGQSGCQRDAVVAHSFANKWTAPVVGMNVQQLKAVFLHDFDRSRLKFSSRDGRKLSSGFHVYRYQQEFFTWHLISDSTAGTAFEVALEGLSAELRLFCLLKTLANFGVRLPWPNLQEALSQAVGMQIITEEQRRLCLSAFEEQVAKGLHAEGLYFSRERLEKVTAGLVTSPSHVMGIFAEMGVFPPAEDPWALYKAARGDLLGSSGPGAFEPEGFRVPPAGLLVLRAGAMGGRFPADRTMALHGGSHDARPGGAAPCDPGGRPGEAARHPPTGYTDAGFVDDRTRHRILANGWHWGVARRLLAILVIMTTATQAASEPWAGPAQSALQWMVEQFGAGAVPMEPPPRLRPELELPDDDLAAHWEMAQQLRHCTVARRPQPALERVLVLWPRWRHEVRRLRRQVLSEIAALVEDMEETTGRWLAERPASVRSTYMVPGKARHTQISGHWALNSAATFWRS